MKNLQIYTIMFKVVKTIDMGKLRELSKNDPELNRILLNEPLQMSETEFISKFSLLWNLAKKGDKQ